MRIGIIDSGVNAGHPHVNGVAGGIGILADGREDPDYLDRLGHGTAVTAVIREKAPEAEIFAVKIFYESLVAHIAPLVAAIDWCIRHRMELINLSLGTSNPAHAPLLAEVVARVRASGALLIAAGEDAGVRWLPGALPGVIAVELDWECPRHVYRLGETADSRAVYRASGYPRPAPGIPPERNLKGLSFAVANVTGLLAHRSAPTTPQLSPGSPF